MNKKQKLKHQYYPKSCHVCKKERRVEKMEECLEYNQLTHEKKKIYVCNICYENIN